MSAAFGSVLVAATLDCSTSACRLRSFSSAVCRDLPLPLRPVPPPAACALLVEVEACAEAELQFGVCVMHYAVRHYEHTHTHTKHHEPSPTTSIVHTRSKPSRDAEHDRQRERETAPKHAAIHSNRWQQPPGTGGIARRNRPAPRASAPAWHGRIIAVCVLIRGHPIFVMTATHVSD